MAEANEQQKQNEESYKDVAVAKQLQSHFRARVIINTMQLSALRFNNTNFLLGLIHVKIEFFSF